jgi:hypothetical protein
VSKKMAAICDIAQCSLVEADRRFRGSYCTDHQGDETSANFYETIVKQEVLPRTNMPTFPA